MPEYYGKYQTTDRRETNATIDDPVIFLGGYTKAEIAIAMIIFIAAMYFLGISWIVTVCLLPASPLVLKTMRFIRTKLPPNFFMQFLWHFGFMNSNLEKYVERPSKTYLSR